MKKLDSFCKNKKLDLIINEELFEKVSDSVEYPFVLFANFSKSYFDLPEFLIKSVMTEKQEYFCFMNKARLSNNFAFVSSKNDY